jgi:hypothetical protein
MLRSTRVFRRNPLFILVQAAVPAMLTASFAHAAFVPPSCTVTSNTDNPGSASFTPSPATLRDCILYANKQTGSSGAPNGNVPITFSPAVFTGGSANVITLGADLPMLYNNTSIDASTLSAPVTINGAGQHRIFFVSGLPDSSGLPLPAVDTELAIAVTLKNLQLNNGKALGGSGGAGGMGAGGALFVNANASVTLNEVGFSGNSAAGGAGGPAGLSAGGGGMGGNSYVGGYGTARGGGGLGGSSSGGFYNAGGGIGTNGTQGPDQGGSFGGTGIGQLGYLQNFGAGFGGGSGAQANGGIGGGGITNGNGGFGGGGGANGNGGFGGGGGKQMSIGATSVGNGGFGGGGGTGLTGTFSYASGSPGAAGAIGGFGAGGGGGGGGGGCQIPGTPGAGGIGGAGGVGGGIGATGLPGDPCPGAVSSSGIAGGGGGGAGFGGAVFLRAGATLTFQSSGPGISGGSVAAGPGGVAGPQGSPSSAGAGAAAGAGMFMQSGSNTTFDITNTVTFGDAVADDSFGSLPGGTYTAGSGAGPTITKNSTGTLIFPAGSNFAGSVTINGGLLQVDGGGGTIDILSGDLGGTGTVGDITLETGDPAGVAPNGSIAPGDSPGTLNAHSLLWKGAASPSHTGIKFQMGTNQAGSDLMQMATTMNGNTTNGNNFNFHFTDAAGPPTPGADYVLATFGTTDINVLNFHYTYTGTGGSITGTFSIGSNPLLAPVNGKAPTIGANALMFHVNNGTPVRLQSFDVD